MSNYKKITARVKPLKYFLSIAEDVTISGNLILKGYKGWFDYSMKEYCGKAITLYNAGEYLFKQIHSDYYYHKDWLEDIKEEVDWSKVPKDTKVLVSNNNIRWNKRYFSEHKNRIFCCYVSGCTSWSGNNIVTSWEYCKLYEEE